MASTREQLQLLQKAQKRARVQTADDDSILEEETVDEHAEEDTTASHDQENKQPVQFQRGTTNQGNICLWYREFRYVRTRKNGIWFRCEQRSCKASLLLQHVENLTGILGPNEHNYIAAPSRQQAETSRQGMKQQIHANPRARPFRLRAQGRADVDDEVFERMGTDEALDRMIARDYLAALLNDVDKQVDTARAVRLQHSRARLTRSVIKEQHVTNILDAANFDTDDGLIDAVHLLGLVMQGFVDGLRVPNEDEEENETSEEE
ncbi:hypothetical protein DdX_05290 [Ditylenchus destructor]|uniref:FLYWCH-type domain-containing protein n=1 Tax=Ditylenchus destructor TaxID=166010 RepID=A0AAD4NC39_9BILA|nr:hypothetical protein DdX_05290 [Ditylenchus destructor]